ncbi:MAG: sugar transferase, partial [Candidatus Edwardsbacteria bacterium]|nr:sugar transferase [Candidatus Edwardsbacteria bacterium]
ALLRSFFYGIITLILLSFVLKLSFIFNSRTFLALYAAIGSVTMIVFRLFIVRSLYRTLSRGRAIKSNVIIIGTGHSGQLLAEKLVMEEVWGMTVVGFVDDDPSLTGTCINKLPVLGTARDIRHLVAEHRVQEVIFAIDNITHQRLMGMIDRCRGMNVRIKLTSELFRVIHQHLLTEQYAGISVVDLSSKLAGSSYYQFYKRMFDIVVATVGLLVMSPVIAVIALLIKATSPGPLTHKQVRIGKDGRPFDFYKFRSMTVTRDDDPERKQQMIEFIRYGKKPAPDGGKIVNEQRITWIGRIIRKMSLDELPQLVNVIKGDMSLVGPRPCLPYEYAHFEDWQKKRTAVLPGCTGLWQVTGRGKVSFNDSVVLDLYYINNMSPWFDLLLILKTIPVMALAKNTK